MQSLVDAPHYYQTPKPFSPNRVLFPRVTVEVLAYIAGVAKRIVQRKLSKKRANALCGYTLWCYTL